MLKRYLDEQQGRAVDDLWGGNPVTEKGEATGYPTQKPVALLDLIIRASSHEGDMILDPFCGCATALVAADRLNREWAGIDLSPLAARLVLKRLREDRGPLFPRHVEITQCCPVRWQFIGHHLIRRIPLLLEQFAHQLECCFLVPPGLNQDIQHLTLAVHRPP